MEISTKIRPRQSTGALAVRAAATHTAPVVIGTEQLSAPARAGRLLIPAGAPLPHARRLVVLVPDAYVDEAGLAARIWALASPRELDVLLLGTIRQPVEQFRARRRLATIAAITRDRQVSVQARLALDSNWLQATRQVCRPDDLLICPDELRAVAGLRSRPLASALLAAIGAPVYVLSGFYPDLPSERPQWLVRMAAWLPPLLILAAFFVLQARLLQSAADWLQTTLLYLSVGAEFALIIAWERFIGTLQ